MGIVHLYLLYKLQYKIDNDENTMVYIFTIPLSVNKTKDPQDSFYVREFSLYRFNHWAPCGSQSL